MRLFHLGRWSARDRFRVMIVAIVVEFVSLIADIRGRNYVGAVLIACGTGAMTWFAAARIRKLAREESEAMSENKD